MLTNATGTMLYANIAARQLLGGGRKLEGLALSPLLESMPASLREAFEDSRDRLFTVDAGRRSAGVPRLAPPVPAQWPAAPPAAAEAADARGQRAGSRDLEAGDPRHRARDQQLGGADRLAGAVGAAAGASRPTRRSCSGCSARSRSAWRTCRSSSTATRAFAKLPCRGQRAVDWQRFLDSLQAVSPFVAGGIAAGRDTAGSTSRSWSRS